MNISFENKVVLVTGASEGVGLAIAISCTLTVIFGQWIPCFTLCY